MKLRNNSLRQLITMTALASIVACSESTSSQSGSEFGNTATPETPTTIAPTTFNQQALLANVVDNIITPTYQLFLT